MQKNNKTKRKKVGTSLFTVFINNKYSTIYVLIAIIVLTIIAFSNSLKNGFTTYDDTTLVINKYVSDFKHIDFKTYFTPDFIRRYDPLTIISHALVFLNWGNDPGPFHLVNLILHLLNVILICFFISQVTDKKLIIWFVTLFFAIHPLHVESVTWITERKDVLYSFFFIFSMIFYLFYCKNSKAKLFYYLLSVLFFLASLLSKFAAVVLPAALLTLDYYLGRKRIKNIIIDKIPFLVLTAIFGYIQLFSEHTIEGNQLEVATFNYLDKIFLCTYSLSFYLIKIIIPFNLYAIRPYPVKFHGFLPWSYYMSALSILILSIFIYWFLKKYPKHRKTILFGLLFFLVNTSLVLHIIPFGGIVIAADRYAYMSSLGLLFICGSFFNSLYFSDLKKIKSYVYLFLLIYLVYFSYETYQRNKIWKNSIVLFSDVIEKNQNVPFAWYARGNALQEVKNYADAISDYNKSIELDSSFADRYYNRGLAKFGLSDKKGAYKDLSRAIQINPKYSVAYFNRGLVDESMNLHAEAIMDYTKALLIDTGLALAFNNRASVKLRMQAFELSLKDYNIAVRLSPNSPEILANRARTYLYLNNNSAAIADCNKSIRLNPNYPLTYFIRGICSIQTGRRVEGCSDLNVASQLGMVAANEYISRYCNNK